MLDSKQLETIQTLLRNLLDLLTVSYQQVEITQEHEGMVRANIESEEAPLLIGTFGERLEALQKLVKNILWQKGMQDVFVIVDVDHYKKQREEKMLALADEKVEAAKETNVVQMMPPLDPYLRKIIHLHLADREGIETESEGEGKRKRIHISYVGA